MNEKFIQLSKELKHRPILEKALGYFPNLPLVAIDCGCGAGNESAYLLSKGFNVHAFDISIDAQKSVLIDLKMTLNLFSIMNLLKTLISRLQA